MTCSSSQYGCALRSCPRWRSMCRLRSRLVRHAIRCRCSYVACLCGLWPIVVGDISISDGDS
jgi:hypothetical protein